MFRVASSEAGAWADGPGGVREADWHGAARAWFTTGPGRAGDFLVRPSSPPALLRARGYFGAQAIAGIVWWFAVFASDSVRRWTLGGWNPAVLVAPDLVLFVGASAVAALLGNRYFAGVAALWTVALTAALAIYGLVAHAAGWGVACMALASFGSVVAAATLWFGRVPTRWFFMGPFAFREAEERSSARNLRRSLTQLVVFWTTFFVVVPIVVASLERRLNLGLPFPQREIWTIVGIVVFALASALGLWSCITMALLGDGTPLPVETARHLVVAGPYRFVRNPMAVAGGLQTAAVGLVVGSWMVVALAIAGAIVWNAAIRPVEEADLAARFGAPYERYQERVRCWVPVRSGQRESGRSPDR